jgi:hypothetical protein
MLLFGAFGYLYCFVDVATQPNPTQLPAAQGQAVVLRYHPQGTLYAAWCSAPSIECARQSG